MYYVKERAFAVKMMEKKPLLNFIAVSWHGRSKEKDERLCATLIWLQKIFDWLSGVLPVIIGVITSQGLDKMKKILKVFSYRS